MTDDDDPTPEDIEAAHAWMAAQGWDVDGAPPWTRSTSLASTSARYANRRAREARAEALQDAATAVVMWAAAVRGDGTMTAKWIANIIDEAAAKVLTLKTKEVPRG